MYRDTSIELVSPYKRNEVSGISVALAHFVYRWPAHTEYRSWSLSLQILY